MFHGFKNFQPGAFFPFAGAGGLSLGGNGPIGVKPTEMVDAHKIKNAQRSAHTADPPCIAGFFVVGPCIQRVAPVLAVGTEKIGRAARHTGGKALFVGFKQIASGPGIGGIGRNINGHIPHDAHIALGGLLPKQLPLAVKLILHKAPVFQLIALFLLHAGQGLRTAGTLCLGPVLPVAAAVFGF